MDRSEFIYKQESQDRENDRHTRRHYRGHLSIIKVVRDLLEDNLSKKELKRILKNYKKFFQKDFNKLELEYEKLNESNLIEYDLLEGFIHELEEILRIIDKKLYYSKLK